MSLERKRTSLRALCVVALVMSAAGVLAIDSSTAAERTVLVEYWTNYR